MRSPVTPLLFSLALWSPAIAVAQTPTRMRVVQDQPTLKTLETAPLTPPPAGLPPQGIRFESSATWGIFAKLAWNPAPNATGYVVTRAKRDDATCCNATSGTLPATATSWADVGLYRAGYYRYTLTVNYADGSVGNGAVDMGSCKAPLPPGSRWTTWARAGCGSHGILHRFLARAASRSWARAWRGGK